MEPLIYPMRLYPMRRECNWAFHETKLVEVSFNSNCAAALMHTSTSPECDVMLGVLVTVARDELSGVVGSGAMEEGRKEKTKREVGSRLRLSKGYI